MSTTTTFQAKVDPEKKKMADAIYRSLGTSTAEAFRIFLQKSIEANGFPFTLTLADNPTPDTMRAYLQADEIANSFTKQKYSSARDLLDA